MSTHVCTAGVPKKIYKDTLCQRKGELLVVNGEGESAIEQQRCRTRIKGGVSVGVRVFVRACLGAVLQRHCLLVVL